MLARQFELATGQRRVRNEQAFHATGTMLFGAELLPAQTVILAWDPSPDASVADLLRDAFQVVKQFRDIVRRHFNLGMF